MISHELPLSEILQLIPIKASFLIRQHVKDCAQNANPKEYRKNIHGKGFPESEKITREKRFAIPHHFIATESRVL